ncbi:MAG: carbohydrate ABC transporter permease [Bacillaceae bacterium]
MTKKNNYFLLLLNIVIGIVLVFPLLYAGLVSFMTPDEVFSTKLNILPSSLHVENYTTVFETAPMATFVKNSFIVSIIVTIGQVIVCSLAAYAFAMFRFRGKNFLFIAILATMMIPGESTIIANYLTIGKLELMDTYTGLTVPFLVSATGVFLMRQYFLTLPKDLYEAAKMDGCGNLKYFFKVVLPLSRPAIGSLGVYTFLNTWNQYMWPLLITNQQEMRTVQIGVAMLRSAEAQSFGIIMAGIMAVLIPSTIIFIVGQKQLVAGITGGAVKG